MGDLTLSGNSRYGYGKWMDVIAVQSWNTTASIELGEIEGLEEIETEASVITLEVLNPEGCI